MFHRKEGGLRLVGWQPSLNFVTTPTCVLKTPTWLEQDFDDGEDNIGRF